MLRQLSLRNARRQARDYLVYFITLVLSASSIFGLNSLLFSKDLESALYQADAMRLLMGFVFAVVAVALSWLIQYMMNFILARRSRELALYLLLGVNSQRAARIFLSENLCIGAAALLAGYLGGGVLYQVLKAVTLHMMGGTYRLKFDYSLGAVGVTALLFAAVYLLSALRSSRKIRRLKLCDLLYYESKNETARPAHSAVNVFLFCASVAAFAAGVYFFVEQPIGKGNDFAVGLICIAVFLYFFFTTFPNFVAALLGRGSWKYKGSRLIVLRNFTAKLRSMGKTAAFLSIIFTVSLLLLSAGMLCTATLNYRADMIPFDFSVAGSGPDIDLAPYQAYADEYFDVRSEAVYPIYQSDSRVFSDLPLGLTLYNYRLADYCPEDLCMAHSDYARLRAMLGYPPAPMGSQEYLVHCFDYDNVRKPVQDYLQAHPTLAINGQTLTAAGVCKEDFDQYDGFANGSFILLVVPDALAKAMPVRYTKYSVITGHPLTAAQTRAFVDAFPALFSYRVNITSLVPENAVYLDARSDMQRDNGSTYIAMLLPLWYVAFMLCITGITVLVSNLISEEKHYRQEFTLLSGLGCRRKKLEGVIYSQLAFLFLVPLVPAIVLAAVLSVLCATSMGATMFVPPGPLWSNILLAFGIYLGVYLLYFIASCLLLCRGALAPTRREE